MINNGVRIQTSVWFKKIALICNHKTNAQMINVSIIAKSQYLAQRKVKLLPDYYYFLRNKDIRGTPSAG